MELASIGIPKVTQAYMCVKRVAGPYERISYNKEEGLFNTIVHEREKKLRTLSSSNYVEGEITLPYSH